MCRSSLVVFFVGGVNAEELAVATVFSSVKERGEVFLWFRTFAHTYDPRPYHRTNIGQGCIRSFKGCFPFSPHKFFVGGEVVSLLSAV